MKYLKRAFVGNPKSTAAGIASLVSIGIAAYSNPVILAQPEVISTIIAAVGLIGWAPKPKTQVR